MATSSEAAEGADATTAAWLEVVNFLNVNEQLLRYLWTNGDIDRNFYDKIRQQPSTTTAATKVLIEFAGNAKLGFKPLKMALQETGQSDAFDALQRAEETSHQETCVSEASGAET